MVSSLNPSVRGQDVTFTATVTFADGAPATVGTVRFGRGSSCGAGFTQLQAARAVDASGVVTFTNHDIGVGTTTIWACYDGVAGVTLNSVAAVDQVVEPHDPADDAGRRPGKRLLRRDREPVRDAHGHLGGLGGGRRHR